MNTIKIKYNDYEKIMEVDKSILLGDIVEKILHVCNIMIYDIEKIIMILQDNERIVLGSDKATLDTSFENLNFNIKYFDILSRDLSNKNNEFINKYNNYIISKEDERLARRLQNQYNYPPNYPLNYSSNNQPNNSNFLNLLNNYLQNENLNLNNDEDDEDEEESYSEEEDTYTMQSTQSTQSTQLNIDDILDILEEQILNNPQNNETTQNNNAAQNNNATNSNEPNADNLNNYFSNVTTSNTNGVTTITAGNNGSSYLQLSYAQLPSSNLNNQSNSSSVTEEGGQTSPWTTLFSQLMSNNIQPSVQGLTNLGSSNQGTSQEYAQLFLNSLNNLITNPDLEDIKIVCTNEEVAQLKILKFQDFKNSDVCKTTDCNICLEEYDDNDDLMLLKCDHYFHEKCIKHWLLEDSNKCPLCREQVAKGKALI